MRFLFDFLPVLAFFVAFKMADADSAMYVATATLMIASLVQICSYWLLYKRFEKMHLITFVVVLLFGSATLLLRDERFMLWKPTVVLWIFAIAIVLSPYVGSKKSLLQRMMQYSDQRISASVSVWCRTNLSMGVFFFLLGLLNLYVAYSYSREFWVDFKVFGLTALNFIFMLGVLVYIVRHADLPISSDVATNADDESKE